MDIESNCPYLLPVFGETTSHLTSKLNVMDGRRDGGVYIFFNVENSIKSEIRKNCFSKKKKLKRPPPPPPPPGIIFLHQFCICFYVGNSMKREENMKYWKKYIFKFNFFQYLKNS